jgi:dephospho-CoA kinase
MLRLGLTGSIASGKSTTAAMFAAAGAPVFNGDAAVHALYRGAAAPLIEAAFTGTTGGGEVDRARLAELVVRDGAALKKLEGIVHPLVQAEEEQFFRQAAADGAAVAVSDMPLLFETGRAGHYDVIIVVSAPDDVRRRRALERPGMTAARYDALLARQMPDAEKRRRAHFIVDTGNGLDAAQRTVADILRALAARAG